MVRAVTWRLWAGAAVAVAAYIAGGFWLAGDGTAEMWMYRFGTAGVSVAALAFATIYTVLGFRGRAKWWTNTLSTSLVLATLSLVPWAAPLAYVFWALNGYLRPGWLSWAEVAGPAMSALAWLWLCLVWLFLYRTGPAD